MNEQTHRPGSTFGWKLSALLAVLAFAITLAVVVGKQMSTEAMAVLIGIVCGVVASIPTTALLVVWLLRREKQREEDSSRQTRGAYPPVVVIQGSAPQNWPMGSQAGYWPAPAPGPLPNRQFHVVGGDDLRLEQ
jgi:hypothetical protein